MFFNKKSIEQAINEVKSLGKRALQAQNETGDNVTNPNTLSDIKTIFKLMKQFKTNVYVQRVAAHALSNLSMRAIVAKYIVNNGGFELLNAALEKFTQDHKLCWLASSALWNMARPEENREIIGKKGVQTLLKVLLTHFAQHANVANTSIGALSNLSLCDTVKADICTKENMTSILNVLNFYVSSENTSEIVLTSGAGLLANLAVTDNYGSILLQSDALSVIIRLLNCDSDAESTLHRNSCAALNNLVTAENFIFRLLECNGVETIYTFLTKTKNDLFVQLLQNCLAGVECDAEKPITSMHLSALHNRTDLLKKLIADAASADNQMDLDEDEMSESSVSSVGSHIWGNKSQTWTVSELLSQQDANNKNVLQYAAIGKNYELVQFLIKCGADASVLNISQIEEESHRENLEKAVQNAKEEVESVASERADAIAEALEYFPTHLCEYMQTFENNIDFLQVANQF